MISAAPPLSEDVDLFLEQDKKWGLSFLINTQQTAEGRSAGSLGGARQHLLLGRPGQGHRRRDPDPGPAVRRP
jgi:hypothetical protein